MDQAEIELRIQKAISYFESGYNCSQSVFMAYSELYGIDTDTAARLVTSFGGGMGLASACDICIASTDAKFSTSEVRLGLAPSTISPYVIRAIGARQASRYFLTAERISAQQAQKIGLVHEVTAAEELDAKIAEIVASLLLGGPQAQAASKQLIQMVDQQVLTEDLLRQTAQHIAHVRQGSEAKNGLSAFLDKQRPAWINTTAEQE